MCDEEESDETWIGESEGDEREGFAEWFYGMRAYPAEKIPHNAIGNALGQAAANNGGLVGLPGDAPAASGGSLAQPTWAPIGPSRIPNGQTDVTFPGSPRSTVSGRVTAIAIHPADPNIVYASGAQGGVWKTTNALSASPSWTPLTDHQPSLAVGSIAIDPTNPNILYVGTGEPNLSADSYYGQGILRSANGGFTWTVLGGPGHPPGNPGPFVGKSVSNIIIDPATAGSTTTTTLWAATVTGTCNSGSSVSCGPVTGLPLGLWRSTDSGQNWVLQNVPSTPFTTGNFAVDSMVLDPTDHETLYVSVRNLVGATYIPSQVWKSTNAATGAPAVFAPVNTGLPTGSTTAALRRVTLGIGGAESPGTLYAAFDSSFGSQLFGFFKTSNGGASWSHLQSGNGIGDLAVSVGGAGAILTATTGTFAPTWVGRRIILVTSSFGQVSFGITQFLDSSRVRLNVVLTGSPQLGSPWTVGSYPGYCDGQCFFDMTIGVDPLDPDASTVYVGGNPNIYSPDLAGIPGGHSMWRTDDGGASWSSVSQGDGTGGIHVDDHAIAFTGIAFPSQVIDGNDGGLWRTSDQGVSWANMNTNMAITQFQGVSTHSTNPTVVLGGTQDNGTNLRNPTLLPPPQWFHADDGDGGPSAIDRSNSQRMFSTRFHQGGASFLYQIRKTLNGGIGGPPTGFFSVGASSGAGFANGFSAGPVGFYAPVETGAAINPNPVYFGTDRLYRSSDPLPPGPGVASWTAISPVLTFGNHITAIGTFPMLVGGNEVVYTGSRDARIASSSNIGSGFFTWSFIDNLPPTGTPPGPLPRRSVTAIFVDPADATGNTAYVVYSGFNSSTPTTPGHIFRTTNGLTTTPPATWTNISGDLPDIPLSSIYLDPHTTPARIYVGSDIGVFMSEDGGSHWNYLSNGHPVVAVFDLERNPRTGQVISSTHGRGMFELVSDGLPDTTLPLCDGSIFSPTRFNGSGTDAGANDTGVSSIQLRPGATNLTLSPPTYISPGYATYIANTVDLCLPGLGTVRVTDFAGNFCDQAISLPGNPVPKPPTASNTGPYCVGDTIQLNASNVPGGTYQWSGPNGFTSTLQNPTIPLATLAHAGTYSVTVTVDGCTSAAATTTVVVNPRPSAAITSPLSVIALSVGQMASVPDAGPGATYVWSIVNGTITAGAGTRSITFTAGARGPLELTVTVTNSVGCSAASTRQLLVRAADSTDFDGDGLSDKTVFRPATGQWFVARSDGLGQLSVQWGASTDVPVPGNYAGDPRADFAVFRPENGTWYVLSAEGAIQPARQFGISTDIPVTGNFGGDSRTDFAVYRPSNSTWFVLTAEGTVAAPVQWGIPGDIPVPRDYDGDGRADFAVFRPSNGTWYALLSGGGTLVASFGLSSDLPVPADFTGDGQVDIAVFRPSNGTWYVQGLPPVSYGLGTDIPLPANMSGDSRADNVLWRDTNGTWYVRTGEGTGLTPFPHGAKGDIPLAR